MENMVLVMIDECGDEVEIERFTLAGLLDEDELELWCERKCIKAREKFPEARGFYFEDRRSWASTISRMLHEDF